MTDTVKSITAWDHILSLLNTDEKAFRESLTHFVHWVLHMCASLHHQVLTVNLQDSQQDSKPCDSLPHS